MKIVQTLWTAGRSLTENAFGWCSPEVHLLAWTYSCMSLHGHNERVVLYADSEAAHILADKIRLPYTDVIVRYDNLRCPAEHWAYPKILTYSDQSEPFAHIDGDIFLPYGLPDHLKGADIIAQNEEQGTAYYKGMMNGVLAAKPLLPDYLRAALARESIGSYNMGIFGGKDINFINEYCEEALRVIRENRMNQEDYPSPNVNNNIMFEQVLLHAFAKTRSRHVSVAIDRLIRDNGYTREEFCNVKRYRTSRLSHILGGHKRSPIINEQIRQIVMAKYPDCYMRVLSLFPHSNVRLCPHYQSTPNARPAEGYATSYEGHLHSLVNSWKDVPTNKLLTIEHGMEGNIDFINTCNEEKQQFLLFRHPLLEVYTMPHNWTDESKRAVYEKISSGTEGCRFYREKPLTDVAIIPTLSGKGYREVMIGSLAYNILALLDKEMTCAELMDNLFLCFSKLSPDGEKKAIRLARKELEFLMDKGIVYATDFNHIRKKT